MITTAKSHLFYQLCRNTVLIKISCLQKPKINVRTQKFIMLKREKTGSRFFSDKLLNKNIYDPIKLLSRQESFLCFFELLLKPNYN